MSDSPRTYRSPRRAREAARTRQDILHAARELFVARGYQRVTMADIACAAGTAVKTVYASVGTKTEVLHELLNADVAASAAEATVAVIRRAPDLAAATACLAHGTRADHERFRSSHDLLYASLGDEGAERTWNHVIAAYRGAIREAAVEIVAKGLATDGLDVTEVADRLWFCFGIAAWRTLVVDCGWDYDKAEKWLARQAVGMLTEPASHSAPTGALNREQPTRHTDR